MTTNMPADSSNSLSIPLPSSTLRFQFGLKHVLYAVTLFAASLSLGGGVGLVVAPFILLFWWSAFSEIWERAEQDRRNPPIRPNHSCRSNEMSGDVAAHRPGFTFGELFVVLAMMVMIILLLGPAKGGRPYYRYRSNLDRISRALRVYHDQFGCLPPAYVPDTSGRPTHSWRVLILPQLGYGPLCNSYRFDEPWDSPNNMKLLGQMPSEFEIAGPSDDCQHMTALQVVVGTETAWPGAKPRSLTEITDGHLATLLVVECENHPVPWTAPEDLNEDEAIICLTSPPRFPDGYWEAGFFRSAWYGRLAILASGDYALGMPVDPDGALEMLRVADGRAATNDDWCKLWLDRTEVSFSAIHYVNILILVVFFSTTRQNAKSTLPPGRPLKPDAQAKEARIRPSLALQASIGILAGGCFFLVGSWPAVWLREEIR